MFIALQLAALLYTSPIVQLEYINDGYLPPPQEAALIPTFDYDDFVVENYGPNDYIPYDYFRNLILPDDPSTLVDITYQGLTERHRIRHLGEPIIKPYEGYLYYAEFQNKQVLDIMVYNNMSKDDADIIANRYAILIGQMPEIFYKAVIGLTVFIGEEGGPSGPYTEHSRPTMDAIYWDFTEEMLLHSFTHASVNYYNPNAWIMYDPRDNETIIEEFTIIDRGEWLEAAEKDNYYMTPHSDHNPETEDIAEVIYAYLASRWRPYRFDPDLIDYLNQKLYHRFEVFDSLELDLS